MISEKLRNALSAFAMFIMVAGPVLAIVTIIGCALTGLNVTGAFIGMAIKVTVASILGGGVLRMLISIDTRLEQRA